MKPATLDRLIIKYYEGDTSIQEEQQLREFFQREDLSESQTEAKVYFTAMDQLSNETLSADFDELLTKKIKAETKPSKWKISTYWFSGVAAAILIFLTVWLGPELIQPKEVYGTITDPKMAFMETKKALGEVSQQMKKGTQPVKKTVGRVEESIDQAGEIKKVNKALEKTKSLNKLEEASDLLKSFSKVTIISGNS